MLTQEYIYRNATELFDTLWFKLGERPQTYDEIILTLTTINSLINEKITEVTYESME